jgi:hypothetical protein
MIKNKTPEFTEILSTCRHSEASLLSSETENTFIETISDNTEQ